MWRKLFSVAVCSLFLGSALGAVNVEINYETYNEHVRKFMVEQLGPLNRSLSQFGKNVNLRFYPFGRTKTEQNGTFTCPNGQTQCYANALHTCYLGNDIMSTDEDNWPTDTYNPWGQQSMASMAVCFFENQKNIDDPKTLALSCGASNNVRCSTGLNAELKALNNYFAKKTASTLIKNGLAVKINDELLDGSKVNLVREICFALGSSSNSFEVCRNFKPKVSVFHEANHQASGKYFNKQIFPYIQALEHFVDFDLVPYGSINLDKNSYQCIDGLKKDKCLSTVFQALVVHKYISTQLSGDSIFGTNRAINFINCVSSQDTCETVFNILWKCSEENLERDDYWKILSFMQHGGDEYRQIMKDFKDKTKKAFDLSAAHRPQLPLVQINGKTNINAYRNIVRESCSQYHGPIRPTICNKVTVDVLYQPMDRNTQTVFLETIKPLFDNLQNVVDFNFIPAGNLRLKPSGGSFQCSTPELCDSLRYQACFIDHYWYSGGNYSDPSRQDVFDAVQCMLKYEMNLTVQESAQVCSEMIANWSDIERCHKNEADAILGKNIKFTDSLLKQAGADIDYVEFPAIIYQKNQLVKPAHLKTKICSNYVRHHSNSNQPNFCVDETQRKLKLKQRRRKVA